MDKLVRGARELGLELSPQQLASFQLYYELLTDCNRRLNLTAIVDYDEVQVKHFLDSLTAVLALDERLHASVASGQTALEVVDVGAGAGLPGVPLAIVYPHCRVVLVESVGKKAVFLRHLLAELGLEHVEVVAARAEEVGHEPRYRERFDLALSRAVGRLPTLVEVALPLCRIGGSFMAYKKGNMAAELAQALPAMGWLGGSLNRVVEVDVEGLRDGRCLVVVDKVSPTPDKYPRRPGLPSRRPLVQPGAYKGERLASQ